MLFAAFVAGGGLYDIFDKPPTIINLSQLGYGGYTAVRGMPDEQTLLESFLSMFLTVLTFAGLLISFKCTEVIYDSRRATGRLVFGILLLVMGLAGSFYLLNLKQQVLRTVGY